MCEEGVDVSSPTHQLEGDVTYADTFSSPAFRLLALCIVFISTLHLRVHSQSQAAISGTIVDSEGQPLSGVKLFLWDSSSSNGPRRPALFDTPAAISDANGSFRINVKGAGRYLISPTREGFVYPRRRSAPNEAGVWVRVEGETQVEDVRIALVREASIIGRVVDKNGNSAVQVPVSLDQYTYDQFGTKITFPFVVETNPPRNSLETDDRGEYRFFGVPPGEYYVRLYVDTPLGRFAPVFYPASLERDNAAPLSLKAGDELRLNPMTVVERETATVRLQFPDEGPTRMNSRSISFLGGGGVSTSFAGGRLIPTEWVVELARGTHDVTVSQSGNGPSGSSQSYSETLKWDLTGGGEIIQKIAPIPLVRVAVNISSSSGAVPPIDPMMRCYLASAAYWSSGNCGGDKFLPAGVYELKLGDVPSNVYVVSASAAEHDLLTGQIAIREETNIRIVLGDPGASVGGTVRTPAGEPLPHATVALIPEAKLRTTGSRHRSVTSDVKGRFELVGVAPGTYQIFAWPDIPAGAFRNEAFMERYDGKGLEVRIEGNESVDLSLTGL